MGRAMRPPPEAVKALARLRTNDRWNPLAFRDYSYVPGWICDWQEAQRKKWPDEKTCRRILRRGSIVYFPPIEEVRPHLFYPPTTFGLCPRCRTLSGFAGPSARELYQCANNKCRYQSSIEGLSVFKGTRLPLATCLTAGVFYYLSLANAIDFSTYEISKIFGIKYDSAVRLARRLRRVFRADTPWDFQLWLRENGLVEYHDYRSRVMPLLVALPHWERKPYVKLLHAKKQVSDKYLLEIACKHRLSAEDLAEREAYWSCEPEQEPI